MKINYSIDVGTKEKETIVKRDDVTFTITLYKDEYSYSVVVENELFSQKSLSLYNCGLTEDEALKIYSNEIKGCNGIK